MGLGTTASGLSVIESPCARSTGGQLLQNIRRANYFPPFNARRWEPGLATTELFRVVKLVFDVYPSDLSAYTAWHLPRWAHENDVVADGSQPEQTDAETATLINHAAAKLRTALGNARHDSFEWFLLQFSGPKLPHFRAPEIRQISHILIREPDAADLRVVDMLDEEGLHIPKQWQTGSSVSWGEAWNKGFRHNIESKISKVRRTLKQARII